MFLANTCLTCLLSLALMWVSQYLKYCTAFSLHSLWVWIHNFFSGWVFINSIHRFPDREAVLDVALAFRLLWGVARDMYQNLQERSKEDKIVTTTAWLKAALPLYMCDICKRRWGFLHTGALLTILMTHVGLLRIHNFSSWTSYLVLICFISLFRRVTFPILIYLHK